MSTPPRTRLLVVDDEPLNCDLLRRVLKADFDVVTAVDASEASTVLAEDSDIAIVLIDQMMPEKLGTSFAREAKQSRPELQFIVLTGYDEDPDVVAAKEDGTVSDVVGKPWRSEQLKRAIDNVLSQRGRV